MGSRAELMSSQSANCALRPQQKTTWEIQIIKYERKKALSEKWSGRIVRVAIEGFSLNWLAYNDEHFSLFILHKLKLMIRFN